MAGRDKDAAQLANHLAARTLEVCMWLFQRGMLSADRREFLIGNVNGDAGRSLSVNLRTGRWCDFGKAPHEHRGDLLNLIFYAKNCRTMTEAILHARRFLGQQPQRAEGDLPVAGKPASQEHHAIARAIWKRAIPMTFGPGSRYFAKRGIQLAAHPHIKYQGRLYHPEGGRGSSSPGLVVRIVSADNQFMAVHRIYITPDGEPDRRYEERKLSFGDGRGGSVHLSPAGRVLWLSEGVEDGAALREVVPSLSVWAGVSSKKCGLIELPDVAEIVVCAFDNDPEGEAAYEMMKTRYPGRTVLRFRPHSDVNADLLADREGLAARILALPH